jgi:hypothetical protein
VAGILKRMQNRNNVIAYIFKRSESYSLRVEMSMVCMILFVLCNCLNQSSQSLTL